MMHVELQLKLLGVLLLGVRALVKFGTLRGLQVDQDTYTTRGSSIFKVKGDAPFEYAECVMKDSA
jgi:hypothetical protein